MKHQSKHHISTIKRALHVQEIVATHYEPGRQDRCKRWVWRTKVLPEMGISEKRFYEYLTIEATEENHKDDGQLKLF